MSELLRDDALPQIPKSEQEKQMLFPQYIMFRTIRTGKREYLCSCCGGKWIHDRYAMKEIWTDEDRAWDSMRVNDYAVCPKCGCTGLVKNRKTFTPKWRASGIVYLFPVAYDYVVARCVLYEKYGDAKRGAENVITETETNRYHFREGMKTVFCRYGMGKVNQVEHVTEPMSWNHGMYTEKYGYSAFCVEQNGMDVKKDTFLKYFPDEQLSDYCRFNRHYPSMKLTAAYARHPRQVETLCKVGQFEAVFELADGAENRKIMNWNALTPWDIHGLGKQEFEYWKKQCHSDLKILKLYRFIGTDGVKGMEKARDIWTRFSLIAYDAKLSDVETAVRFGRKINGKPDGFLCYIEKLAERYNAGACSMGFCRAQNVYDTYLDYVELVKKAGYADKAPQFPHDLKERHDRLVAELWAREEAERKKRDAAYARQEEERKRIQEEQERKRREETERKYPGVRERYEKIRERYAFSDGTYSIVVPSGAADIVDEGNRLLHCTGTTERYFARIQSGESYIFFLRKAKKPDVPWYTLEVEPGGTIRQKRTKFDRQEDDLNAAIPFLRKWQEAISPRMGEDDLRAAVESKRLRIAELEELRRNDTRIRNGQMAGQRLADVLTDDLMEAILEQRGGTAEPVREVKKA